MSQYTDKGFPLFSGSIQYSLSPLEYPESRIALHDLPGWLENQSLLAVTKNSCS